jgi:ELP3 family radical SAM enzyme/protein acetyltransferase
MSDIEDYNENSINQIVVKFINELLEMPYTSYENNDALSKSLRMLSRKYKVIVSKKELSETYLKLSNENPKIYIKNHPLRFAIMKKAVRSSSGIVNITVVTPPDRFSCKFNCHFCPNEPGMPRSYLSNEDAVARAASVDFNTVRQVWKRFDNLEKNGHPIDKIEFRVLGGTFSCYDKEIIDEFIRDLYYAANTYYDFREEKYSIQKEQELNVNSQIHVVGLGVETRPDMITLDEIIRFRNYGVTRVELGVQHTNDTILRKVNRGHTVKHSKDAIKLLKEYGFKIEIHIMADLPNSSPELDKECYEKILKSDPDLIPDYMKDYPCLDVDFTEIKKWKADGRWKPYAEIDNGKHLHSLLIYRQSITPVWVRVNRIQRDFRPSCNGVLGFTSETLETNLGDVVTRKAEALGIYCKCIRCSEIKHEKFKPEDIVYKIYNFNASGAQEYFICAVIENSKRDILLGFIRLRLCNSLDDSVIPELVGKTAMIRELHVYGQVNSVGTNLNSGAQHRGIGKQLMKAAETLAITHGYEKLAVISGIGVRGYYAKLGYSLEGSYMIKSLESIKNYRNILLVIIFLLFTFLLTLLYVTQ